MHALSEARDNVQQKLSTLLPSATARLAAVTVSGPIYEEQGTANLVPLSCALATLQELAARTRDPKVTVVSSAAARASGQTAFESHTKRTLSYSLSLTYATPDVRVSFLGEVLEYVRREGADGIEGVLMAAVNAAWPWLREDVLNDVIESTTLAIERAGFAQKYGTTTVDVNTRSVLIVRPGLTHRTRARNWLRDRRLNAKDWQLGLTKERPAEGALFGDGGAGGGSNKGGFDWRGTGAGAPAGGPGISGMPANSIPGFGDLDSAADDLLGKGDNPFGGAPQGGLGGGMPAFGNASNSGGSKGGRGRGSAFGGGGPGSNGGWWGGGMSGSSAVDSLFGSLDGGATAGPFGSLDFGQSGGPTGFGAALNDGGAESWEGEHKAGMVVIFMGLITVSIGATIGSAPLVAAGAAEVAAGGILISDANHAQDVEIKARERAEDKAEKEQEKAEAKAEKEKAEKQKEKAEKEKEKEKEKEGKTVNVKNLPDAKKKDQYPDPHKKGGQLPVGDGEGGGNPTMLPAGDGTGGGRPDTLPTDDDTQPPRPTTAGAWGDGNLTSIWDEYGGGVTPVTVGHTVAKRFLYGPGVQALVMQVGPSTLRY